uniref:triadin-like isoform X3 n=1 Tax=Doryrhamphus excisus TaxID=161450 RepID=UPI0025AECA99|nr:triadin-like isoform X3 [Doryrhamphus excisus]
MASQASSKSKSSSAMSSGGDTAPPARANQRTILDDIILTFSSPMAWLLVVALVITWTAVAVVLFDLLDYKTLAGLPPPPAIAKRGLKARGGVRQIRSPISEVAPPQESTDWLEMMWTFAAGLVAPDDEDIDEGVEALHSEEL